MRVAAAPVFESRLAPAPGGGAGVYHTVALMRDLVREARIDPTVINAAVGIVHFAPEKDEFAEIHAIFDYVLNHVRYVRDVAGLETLCDPRMTLKRLVGDCDDKSTLLATLLEAVGYPTRFVMGAYDGGDFSHIYVQVYMQLHDMWIDLDSTEYMPMGWAAPNATRLWIENV
jgi:transglutaminase-like putative cysteine protease